MSQKTVEKIKNNSYKFNLVTQEVNENILIIYSPKYDFDTWMIQIEEKSIKLYHSNKKYNNKKCSFHLQNEYKLRNWFWCLKQIDNHNKYVINRKNYLNTNWVTDVLNKHNKRLYVN